MMKSLFLWVFSGLVFLLQAGGKYEVMVVEDGCQNLLRNVDFQVVSGSGVPEGWEFRNYSESTGFEHVFLGDFFRLKTSGGLYGYLVQGRILVEEGRKYHAEVLLRQNTRSLLWIVPVVYAEGLKEVPPSYRSAINPEHGENLRRELANFIDPAFLQKVSDTEWIPCHVEFTVPEGKGITHYDFRIGAYGGNPGWMEVRKPFFGRAERKLQLELSGRGMTDLQICQPGGKVVQKIPLNQDADKQQVEILLDSRMLKYDCVIIDRQGNQYRRAL